MIGQEKSDLLVKIVKKYKDKEVNKNVKNIFFINV
jgi:hypothetical protein